jgi:membrane protein DedA with SNARE-associated domain
MEEFVSLSREWLQPGVARWQQLGMWSYALLALLVALEGPFAIMLGAVAAAAGWLNPLLVFTSAAVANLITDILWYTLGSLGKTEWLLRHGRWLRLRREHLAQLEKDMQTHAPRVLLVTKLTSSMVIPSLIAAGLARVNWRRWFWIVLITECARTGLLVFLGYYFARSIRNLEFGMQMAAITGAVVVLTLLGMYFWRYRLSS